MEYGKILFAREFARKLLCINNEDDELCAACIKFNTENHPDFKQIEPDSGSIKIEQIRSMQDGIAQKPIISSKKIYIIRDCDLMTVEAQNCLLKTLEEPPEYAVIILTTSNESKILTTVRSRCMKINFEPISEEKIKEYIGNTSFNFIKMCNGSIGKALEFEKNNEIYNQINNILDSLDKENLISIMKKSEILYKQKDNIKEILDYINSYLFNVNKINCIKYVEEAKRRLNYNSNYDMTIDNLIIKMWEEINEKYSRSSI